MARTLKHAFSLPTHLSARLTLLSGISFFLIATLMGAAIYLIVSQLLFQSLEDKYKTLAHHLATTTLDAVLLRDYAVVERYARDISQSNAELIGVRIVGQYGEPIVEIMPQASRNNASLSIEAPILLGHRKMGLVQLWVSTETVRQTLIKVVVFEVLGLLLLFGMQWLIVRRVLYRHLVQPVDELVDKLGDVASIDGQPIAVPAKASDEVRAIAQRLNTLRAALKAHVDSLQAAHEYRQKATRQLCQQQKMVSIGQMSAGVAHNLNTPLGNIVGYCQLAQEELQAGDVQAAVSCLQTIEKQALICTESIASLMRMARNQPLQPQPLDVAQCVQETVALMQQANPALRRGAAHIEVEQICSPCTAWADMASLELVLANLIENALQANASRIEIRVDTTPTHIHLTLTDNGEGISPQQKRRLFEAFNTSKPAGEGTGLGLFMAKSLLESLDGAIRLLESEPGRTVFEIMLNRMEDQNTP